MTRFSHPRLLVAVTLLCLPMPALAQNVDYNGLEEAFGTEGRFEYEDSIAAASFRFDEFSRGIAADLFVGGPEKKQAVTKRRFCSLQSFEGEEGLDDAGLHVKDAGAIGFSGGDAEGHFAESAGGIDRVVVAENEELAVCS